MMKRGPQSEWKHHRAIPRLKWQLRILLYLVCALLGALSILQVNRKIVSEGLAGAFYGVTALCLFMALWYLYQDFSFLFTKKLKPAIGRNSLTNRLAADIQYRSVFFTYTSFSFNLLFAVSNGIYGLVKNSWWFGTLSAYYILLSVMRFGILRVGNQDKGREKKPEIRKREGDIYRRCGWLFLLLTIALVGSVILMVTKDQAKTYPDTLILAVAAYTFYKMAVSVRNVLKARKMHSPLILTIRHIGYADALVSLLSLQTAMFTTFGEADKRNIRVMNGFTGAAVCILVMMMGVYMIVTSGRAEQHFSNKI